MNKFSSLLLLVLGVSCSIEAFTPLSFSAKYDRSSIRCHAESGPPQYQKQKAVLRGSEVVGNGSVLLHIDHVVGEEDEPLSYQPGHVIALEVQADGPMDEKTAKDAQNNDGWMRGPYTITRCNDKSFDILIKTVGTKSKVLANAAPGTPLRFGGKFKVPIAEGIAPNADRVVMLSTGVGIGPCVGAIETLLSNKFAGSIDLFASFRSESEKLFADYLNELSSNNGNFKYIPIITSEMGRLSASKENVELVVNQDICPFTKTHYHLIGNGQMVTEWKTGLEKAGVPNERITVENYFNHKAEPSVESIDRISEVFVAAATPALVNQK